MMLLRSLLASAALLASAVVANADSSPQHALPLPTVPDSLTAPADRAAFVALHFWDEMDFSAPADTASLELNFSTFASVLPIAPPHAQALAFSRLLELAASSPDQGQLLRATAIKYLDGYDSPTRDYNAFALFVDACLSEVTLSEAEADRLSFLRDAALLNAPGQKAADFQFITRDGSIMSLCEAASGRPTLLIFYSPTCDDCHSLINSLSGDARLWRLTSSGSVCAIAIASAAESDEWSDSPSFVPASWIDALDVTDVESADLYDNPATPSVYIIDADGTVVAKHPHPKQIIDLLIND